MLGPADDLIVEAIGKCESDDLNPKLAYQGLLAAINFVERSRYAESMSGGREL